MVLTIIRVNYRYNVSIWYVETRVWESTYAHNIIRTTLYAAGQSPVIVIVGTLLDTKLLERTPLLSLFACGGLFYEASWHMKDCLHKHQQTP